MLFDLHTFLAVSYENRVSIAQEMQTVADDEVAEWLRRWTANPLGSARVGSNPILVEEFFRHIFSKSDRPGETICAADGEPFQVTLERMTRSCRCGQHACRDLYISLFTYSFVTHYSIFWRYTILVS